MEFENGDIILMDGGFPMDQVEKADPLALWITEYNETNPEAVIQNHISYLRGERNNFSITFGIFLLMFMFASDSNLLI